MSNLRFLTPLLIALLVVAPRPHAQTGGSPTPYLGTWVGTQSWAIDNPPPGSRNDQPVTLTLEMVDGKLQGSLRPFLGGEDGATLVDAQIVGEELRATAVVGRPRTAPAPGAAPAGDAGGAAAGAGGRRGNPPPGWKDPIRIAFAFTNDGVNLAGTADVHMGDTPWMKFKYDLAKKRTRY